MELVEILARELKEWPEGADHAYQDPNKCVYFSSGQKPERHQVGTGWNVASNKVRMIYGGRFGDVFTKAKDHATAIVTRADWQAAKDKLEGKTVKKPNANKDGWVRHRGGKCPVEAGTLVDVRHRDGEIIMRIKALGQEFGAMDCNWLHDTPHKAEGEIMAYRIHTPSEQPETVKESSPVEPVAPVEGPLQWRDRITEIDLESKAEVARHSAAITALDTERAKLVQKLASEGLAMIERKADPVDDMSDWRNWRVGDKISVIKSGMDDKENGDIGTVFKIDEEDGNQPIGLDFGDSRSWPLVDECHFDLLKWHSRPTN